MKKTTKNSKVTKLAQYVLLTILVAIGFIAFMVLAGESETMTLGCFVAYKGVSLAVLALCFFVGKKLYQIGLLPEWIVEDIDSDIV